MSELTLYFSHFAQGHPGFSYSSIEKEILRHHLYNTGVYVYD
jgi:hypothetical protein